MLSHLPFFPPQGSTHAASVDALYLFFVAVTAFFSVLVATLVVVFAVRFRRRAAAEVGAPIHGSLIQDRLAGLEVRSEPTRRHACLVDRFRVRADPRRGIVRDEP